MLAPASQKKTLRVKEIEHLRQTRLIGKSAVRIADTVFALRSQRTELTLSSDAAVLAQWRKCRPLVPALSAQLRFKRFRLYGRNV